MYIALCGVDGCGKSTALRAVVDWLDQQQPNEIVRVREPGSTPAAEALRNILLHSDFNLSKKEQMLLMTSARLSVLNEVVIPAMNEDKHVVSDRCFLSTEVYQAVDDELKKSFRQLHAGIVTPDIILLLDLPVDEADRRMEGVEKDDIERQGIEFQRAARERYLEASSRNPFVVTISSEGSEAETYQNVMEALVEAFLTVSPLSVMIHDEVVTYNGRNGQTNLSLDSVYETILGYGYTFDVTSDGTWTVRLGYNTIVENLLNEHQAIKVAFSDARQRGYWNGLTNDS